MNEKNELQDMLHELEKRVNSCLLKDRHRFARRLEKLTGRVKKNQDITSGLLRLSEEIDLSEELYTYRQTPPIVDYPNNFPIIERKSDIVKAIQENQVVVIAGETGSGKTTQLPKICLDAGRGVLGKIGCTQPRRVAATSIADFVATQVTAEKPAVSYKIRFHKNDDEHTFIKFMTDGILLAEIQNDRYLKEYDTIIIDEAHERSLNIDFILGYLKKILPARPDLKVIISSATMDTKSFSEFYDNAPIIEVSGRTYPVTVFYEPMDEDKEESGDLTVVDASIFATEQLFTSSSFGDFLIFMSTEAEIRETVDRLEGAPWAKKAEVCPLFGRLSSKDQNRIFKNISRRKIVVATNIAETSITIPGIRFVVDTGYARISRYCPKSRTKRLPIEKVSRSSCDQRKGRCGRVEEGICVRLYSEDDFLSREEFTTPEIRRSDLAEVILRMLSLPLGDIDNFAFLDPPSKRSIQEGLTTLRELGAIDKDKKVTKLGRMLAGLPIDPRTARILIEAKKEKVLSHVLVIAAALALQDPRERPFEKRDAADEKHKQFQDPKSDFLTYLNLWKQYHDTFEELKTQSKMRKFCRQNFLSFIRMREWGELYNELRRSMRNANAKKEPKEMLSVEESYEPIHRAILSGYLSNIGQRKDKTTYTGRQQKEFMVFPGSGLFKKKIQWIMAAELVETSRLFARTVAEIEVSWIEPLAKDLCRYSYHEAHWNERTGHVTAVEKVMLWGLVLDRRNVHYGRIHRGRARDIFIQEGLVPNQINEGFRFLKDNYRLMESVRDIENRLRKKNILADNYIIEAFYQEHLPDVVNIKELQNSLQQDPQLSKNLSMELKDVLQEDMVLEKNDFPDKLLFGSHSLPLSYVFDPEHEHDGITIHVREDLLPQLDAGAFDWLIPGWRQEKIEALMRCLPKKHRRQMQPISDRAKEVHTALLGCHEPIIPTLTKYLFDNYKVDIRREDWQLNTIPIHFFMRFVILDKKRKVIAESRDLTKLQQDVQTRQVNALWQKAEKQWFMPNLKTWCFDSLPEKVEISSAKGGIPNYGYPSLEVKDHQVNRTLKNSSQECLKQTKKATALLLEISLTNDFRRLERSLFFSAEIHRLYQQNGWSQNLKEDSLVGLKKHLLFVDQMIRTQQQFQEKQKKIEKELVTIVPTWVDLLDAIFDEHDALLDVLEKPAFERKSRNLEQTRQDVELSLENLFPVGFLRKISFSRLQHYPRYLKAMQKRLEKAIVDPARDRKKWTEVSPCLENLETAKMMISSSDWEGIGLVENYRWLVEEWKVSVFAQELKTAYPVSQKRLKQSWQSLEEYFVK